MGSSGFVDLLDGKGLLVKTAGDDGGDGRQRGRGDIPHVD
jgi:hypothetical protein